MLRLHWNELKTGDYVLVHDVDDPGLKLVPGVVSLVEAEAGSNVVAITLSGAGPNRLVRPHRLAVHSDPIGLDGQCWRCDRPTSTDRRR